MYTCKSVSIEGDSKITIKLKVIPLNYERVICTKFYTNQVNSV